MASVARPALAAVDAYRVLAATGRVGTVEEIWFGRGEEPLAVVVLLRDGRRGLLFAEDVAGVSPDDHSLTMAEDARLLRLDPPHLEPLEGGLPAASWRATGDELELPERGVRVRALAAHTPHPARRLAGERPLWLTLLLMFTTLGVIVGILIGLDFLFSHLVGGGPPY